jgi:hypothetical protein
MKNQGFGSPAFARSDREFVTEEIRNVCAEYGIHWEPTVGYSPWQNGVSERSIRILLERSRAILFDAELPRHLWNEALATAVYITNRVPTSVPLYNDRRPGGSTLNLDIQPSQYNTPYSAWTNSPQDLAHIKKFGSIGWMHLHGSAKPIHKLDARAKKVHLVGYVGNHIYRVWDPDSNTVHVTSDVTFDEHI